MHSIKKAARRSAWYLDEHDDQGAYNPFRRMAPRPRQRKDEENQLHHTTTENDVQSPLEQQRQHDFTSSEYATPPKASTWAGSNGESLPPHKVSDAEPSSDTSGSTVLANSHVDEKAAPVGISDTSAGPVGTDGKARKRRGRKFFSKLGLKKSEEQSDIDYADKDNSKKRKGPYNPNITIMSMLRAVFGSWINIMLPFAIVGIVLGNIKDMNKIVIFCINFVGIIPLAAMLSFATEELALYVGEVLGGLLNASFGNAVELIVSIIALKEGEVIIVQTSLIGSMLSNLLLVLGMCFFFGGINRVKQNFNVTVAQTAASLLALAIGSLIIPTAFSIVIPGKQDDGVTPLSRGTAVLLLVVYACYLVFQLRTHADVYNAPSEKVPKRAKKGEKQPGEALGMLAAGGAGAGAGSAGLTVNQSELVKEQQRRASKASSKDSSDDDDDEHEIPQLTRLGALLTLAGSTVIIAFCAEYMVSAIDELGKDISKEFIGLILLPIVGNAAEHATAVTVAVKDKMDLSIGVCVGSSLQIALLVLPLMILLNWFGVGSPADLTLDFDGFQVAVLFISIILVNYLINDGESHWLEGVMLNVTYLIIALAAWYYPADTNSATSTS